jgi:vacuolar protein sorting-associated protein 13A/C
MSTSLTYINPLFQDDNYLAENNIVIKGFYYEPSFLHETIKELEGEGENKSIIFINELDASSLEFNLTFIAQTKDQMFEKILKPNIILNSFLNILNKTENVPLLLQGGKSYNLVGNAAEIMHYLIKIYVRQILIQFVKLFGGMEILGNPLNFLNNIGKGFQDLLTKPGEGLMQGPIEAVKGVADGATSLVKHTVNGTFNSTSKITSGISQGILFLTQDDDYINEREQKKITEKPKDVMEGIGYGLSALVGGVFYGLSDIVIKPIEGTKKEGVVKGLPKGLLKGLGGAIIKPISGVFDFVSKTTEGIKNGVNEDKTFHRIREPRAFYGIFKIIKEYNYKDAYVKRFLYNEIQECKNSYDFTFYGFVMYKNKKEEPIILVFVNNGFWIVDILRKELKGIIAYSDIKNVELVKEDLIRIFFNKKINNEDFYNIKLSKEVKHPSKIVDKLKNAINSNNWKKNLK